MALTKTMQMETNIGLPVTLTDAYIKVARVNGNKTEMTAEVEIKKDAIAECLKFKTYGFSYDLDGDNPIKQAYKYLKTLPEFEGATDC